LPSGGKVTVSEYSGSNLFDRMNRTSEECLAEIRNRLSTIAKKNGVLEGYPMKKCLEIFDWIIDEINLEIYNENWDDHMKYGTHTFEEGSVSEEQGRRHVSREFLEIIKRVQNAFTYECEKDFGFEEPTVRPKTYAEKYGELLMEAFRVERKDFFNSIPEEDRRQQMNACKKGVLTLLYDYGLCMKPRIPELT
jgi:hypothetical protein